MSKGLHQVFSVAEVLPEKRAGITLILDSVLPAQPGQFVMAWLPDVEERPFSLMDDDPLSLTVADVGPFTRALCALRAGDRLWIRGPYGHGFNLVGERHLLIAGGSGAASLTLLAKAALSRGHKVTAILGAGTAERLMLVCRFERMGCQVIVATDDGSAGYQGNVIDAARERLVGYEFDAVYGCGPEPMLSALVRWAGALALTCQVSMERTMKCGLGICGACHCGDQLVCVDGPVFSGEKLMELLCMGRSF